MRVGSVVGGDADGVDRGADQPASGLRITETGIGGDEILHHALRAERVQERAALERRQIFGAMPPPT